MASKQMKMSALIVVDMQEDFCTPHGSLAIDEARELAPIINALLKRPEFAVKLATQDFHPPDHVSFASQHRDSKPFESTCIILSPDNKDETHTITLWPDHCIQNTFGSNIIREIDQSQLSKIVQKGRGSQLESMSGFGPPFRNPSVSMTEMNSILKEARITHVFVVGVAFDGCVKATAIDAAEFGYETSIIEEAVNASHRSPVAREKTLRELAAAGVSIVSQRSLGLKSSR